MFMLCTLKTRTRGQARAKAWAGQASKTREKKRKKLGTSHRTPCVPPMRERISIARRALPATIAAVACIVAVLLYGAMFGAASNSQSRAVALGCAAVYIVIVQLLRWQRRQWLETVRKPAALADAIAFLEFPELIFLSLEFGLFKTFAVPSISKLLLKNGQFTKSAASCLRRYNDTNLIMMEVLDKGNLDHPRAVAALQRLNAIHGRYRISNGDYLYTLAVFACEPIEFVNRFGWRCMSQREAEAIHNTFFQIGRRMGLKDVPRTVDDMFAFRDEYEKTQFRASPANVRIGEATFSLLLSSFPSPVRPVVAAFARTLMSRALRRAMGIPDPPSVLRPVASLLLQARSLFVRFLLPPRPQWLHTRRPSRAPGPNGLYYSRFNRYGESYPDGYAVEKLGPPGMPGAAKLAKLDK